MRCGHGHVEPVPRRVPPRGPRSCRGSPTDRSCWSPRRSRRRRSPRTATAATPTQDAALAAYDVAATAVADGFAAKAARGHGAATEVLTASAGLTRDKGLRGAVAKPWRQGSDAARRRARRGGAVRRRLHRHGRADGRARHRPARHRTAPGGPPGRRARARRGRRPTSPRCCVAARPRPRRHRGAGPRGGRSALVTERGGATSHTAIIARQLGIPCVVGWPARSRLDGRGLRGGRRRRPDGRARRRRRATPAAGSRPSTGGPRRWLRGPARPHRRRRAASSCWPTWPTASPAAGGGGAGRGRRAVPDRAVLPGPPRRAVRRGAGRAIYAEVLGAFDGHGRPRRRPHPRRRAPTSRSPSRRWRTRRTPPSASAACGCRSQPRAAGAPARRHRRRREHRRRRPG